MYSEEKTNCRNVILRATKPKWKFGSDSEHFSTSLHGRVLSAVHSLSVAAEMIGLSSRHAQGSIT